VTSVFGFTHRRSSGVSSGPYADANLATHVGDAADAVAENRRRFADRRGLSLDRVVWMDQVHGTAVVVVDGPRMTPPTADALVTATPGLAVVVLVADCVPVVLRADDVVAVVHAGRRGAAEGVVTRAVESMRELGAGQIDADIGPAICGACYEVPPTMQRDVEVLLPGSACDTRSGGSGLDLRAGLVAQLATLDVDAVVSSTCTAEAPHLFSHRRDGVTGRQAAYVMLEQ
jgi:YfiH family protein